MSSTDETKKKPMRHCLGILVVAFWAYSMSGPALGDGYGGATDAYFAPTFSNMINGATQFGVALKDYSAASACWSDPQCGLPDDPNAGFELPAGDCCEESADCIADFDGYVGKVSEALRVLYGNERYFHILMQTQKARMAAMRGAGSMSAAGTAVVARMEADIAKAQQGFVDKFNTKAQYNISRLHDFLLGLGDVIDQYCGSQNWYQRNALPLYLHAKIKFPK